MLVLDSFQGRYILVMKKASLDQPIRISWWDVIRCFCLNVANIQFDGSEIRQTTWDGSIKPYKQWGKKQTTVFFVSTGEFTGFLPTHQQGRCFWNLANSPPPLRWTGPTGVRNLNWAYGVKDSKDVKGVQNLRGGLLGGPGTEVRING